VRSPVSPRPLATHQIPAWFALLLSIPLTGGLVLAFGGLIDLPHALLWPAMGVQTGIALVIALSWRRPGQTLGAANHVTLLRATLVSMVGGMALLPAALPQAATALAVVSLLALMLDGVDGWVARRTGSASAYGARFDMELDALFILLLCIVLWLLGRAGAWVVLIGAMRYLFVLAMQAWPWMNRPLPESFRRKAVCVGQILALLVCLLPLLSPVLTTALLAAALGALSLSFGIDVAWLYQHRSTSIAGRHDGSTTPNPSQGVQS